MNEEEKRRLLKGWASTDEMTTSLFMKLQVQLNQLYYSNEETREEMNRRIVRTND